MHLLTTVQLIRDVRDTARQTLFRVGLAVARHRYNMMWLSRHGVFGTASRQVLNVCKQIVYASRTMSGRPDMAGRILTHLSQIVSKLPEVVRPYRPPRQVATRCSLFVQNVCTKCLDLSGHTCRCGRSEQLVTTGRATRSLRFLFQPCRAIIMLCRVANCRNTYVTNELCCRPMLIHN